MVDPPKKHKTEKGFDCNLSPPKPKLSCTVEVVHQDLLGKFIIYIVVLVLLNQRAWRL